MNWIDHLLIAPILLPLGTGAALLLVDERRHGLKAAVNIASTFLLLFIAIYLVGLADTVPDQALARSYVLGSWPAPFGIVLVLDRLAALMIMLAAVLAAASVTFSMARWHRAGPHFNSLFQFLLMGLNGAFLTGDLFNLFVFVEVLLAASYGLLLYSPSAFRVRAGMHYIVINLAASLLFLIGVSLIYGATGTLNMADLAVRLPGLLEEDRPLFEAGAAILGVAFLTKAGVWPLCFWLPTAYMAAPAPVAAVFAVLTKVGIYIILRLTLLLFGTTAGELSGFGSSVLVVGGFATIAFGTIGTLASQALARLAGYSLLVSCGTLLAAVGMADAPLVSGALYYMVTSTLAVAVLFLLVELIERAQEPGADVLAVTMEAYDEEIGEVEEEEEIGVAMPGSLAILGICFGCTVLLLAGLPPLSGFIGKFALLTAAFNPAQPVDGAPIGAWTWIFAGLVIFSGLAVLVAMMRSGIRTFWAPLEVIVPRVLVVEAAPVALLIGLCLAMTIEAGGLMRYTDDAARALHAPEAYVGKVLSVPAAVDTGGASQ